MKTICIAGKNDIAVSVLTYCINTFNDVEIVIVCNKNESEKNGWQKSLLWHAKKYGIKVLTLDEVYKIDDLVFVSVEFDRIIRPEKFSSSKLYNIHFSLLPMYKGCNTSILPILHGNKKTGVVFHRIDSGIDTGEIIEQAEIDINPSDTSYDLYKKLISVGTELVIKCLPSVIRGEEKSKAQASDGSTYYPRDYIKYSELQLNVNTTAYQIQNQIRAFAFRPYQLLSWRDACFIECEILNDKSTCKPGTILEDTETYYVISSIDYNVKLYKDVLSALLTAIRSEDNERAKALCVSDKILNAQEEHGWSPLTVAVFNGNIEMFNYLLQCGANIDIINWNGTTLPMYAKDYGIKSGDWTLFRILDQLGSDLNKTDYAGLSVADYIRRDGMIDKIPDDIKKKLSL